MRARLMSMKRLYIILEIFYSDQWVKWNNCLYIYNKPLNRTVQMGVYKRLVSQACPRPGHMAVSASSHFLPHGPMSARTPQPPPPSKRMPLSTALLTTKPQGQAQDQVLQPIIQNKREHRFTHWGGGSPQIKSKMKLNLKSTIIIHSTNVREVCAPHPYGPFKPAGSLKISLVTTAYGCSITRRWAWSCTIFQECPWVYLHITILLQWNWLGLPCVGRGSCQRNWISLR